MNIFHMPQTAYLLKETFLSKNDLVYQDTSIVLSPSAVMQLLALSYKVKCKQHLANAIIWLPLEFPVNFVILSEKQLEYVVAHPASLAAFKGALLNKSGVENELYDFYVTYYRVSLDFINTTTIMSGEAVRELRTTIGSINTFSQKFEVKKNEMLRLSCQALICWLKNLYEPNVDAVIVAAKRYFTALFRCEKKSIISMSHEDKMKGKQVGCTLLIDYSTVEKPLPTRVVYYVKTHQGGRTWECFNTGMIDLREMFVYWVLKFMGLGPKAYFFKDTSFGCDVYIATQDLSTTKVLDKKNFFLSFGDVKLNPNVCREVLKIEIIERLLRLTDVLSNADNMGIVCLEGERYKAKVVDFAVKPDFDMINYSPLIGFQNQSGCFRYPPKVFQALITMLPNRNVLAKEIISELTTGIPHVSKPGNKDGLLSAMEKAKIEVAKIQEEYSAHIAPQAIKKYTDYCGHVVKNYRLFLAIDNASPVLKVTML